MLAIVLSCHMQIVIGICDFPPPHTAVYSVPVQTLLLIWYKYKFGFDQSIIKSTLIGERCMFSPVSCFPLEEFFWKFILLYLEQHGHSLNTF
jgi:hypothetical protein